MWELADYKNEFNGIKNDINKSNPAKKKTSSFENFDDNEKNYGSVRKRKDVSAPKIPLNYQNSICNQLKISVWNIHGLSDKLGDPDIQNYIKQFHIVAFIETKKNLKIINLHTQDILLNTLRGQTSTKKQRVHQQDA